MISRRKPFDLDNALDSLVQEIATSTPEPDDELQERVLDGAAQVLIDRYGTIPKVTMPAPGPGDFARRSRFDAWARWGVAAAAACLLMGFGLGYEWGQEILIRAGIERPPVVASDPDIEEPILAGDFL